LNTSGVPDISVCIANYNGGDLVLACIDSVLSQLGDFRLEVLVHDDVSNDDSVQRIRERYPDIHIFESERNVGFCISNNRMAELAKGRYLLLLNNDAILRPGSLSALLDCAEDGRSDCILGLPQHSMVDGALVDRGYRTDPFLNPIPILQPGLQEAGVVTGACFWIPKSVWIKIGGFPEWFESVAEDIFLCFAARLLGHRVFVLDVPGFDHWIGRNLGGGKVIENTLRTTTRRRTLSERNKTFAMLCCYPGAALLVLLPIHIAALSGEVLFLLLAGTPLKALRNIYASIPFAVYRQWRNIGVLRKRLIEQRSGRGFGLFAFTDWLPHKLVMLLRHGRPRLD